MQETSPDPKPIKAVWLVAVKVAAQYQPAWRTARDFLTPNGYWHPKSLKRVRAAKESGAARAPLDSEAATTRRSA